MDLIPPPEDDPHSEPLQITPDQQRQYLYCLSFDSAAGNTGWTNSMLYALCNDRATPDFQAGLTPPSSLISARTVKLMGDGRTRAASNNVKTIGGLLEGELYAEPLSGAALQ